MKWRGTLTLLIIFVCLLGFYWALGWFESKQVEWREEAKKIFDFSPEAVRELHIQQVGGPLCIGSKEVGRGWRFEKPSPDIPAFSYMWDRVAKNLSELKNHRTILLKMEDKRPYGLDVPSLVVKAVVDGLKEPVEIKFGFLDPTNTYRYATMDETSVFLVDDKQFFELNRSLEDLRHRFLVKDRETPLVRIEFARYWTEDDEVPEGSYVPAIGEESVVVILERENEKSPWYVVSPSKGLANQEAVNALANEIQFGMGRNFVDSPENLADYGLDPPRCRLTYYDAKERSPQTLYLGGLQTAGQSTQEKDKEKRKRLKLSECTGVFARLAGQKSVFLLDTHILELLPRSPESFRDRHILTKDVGEIVRIERRKEGDKIFSLVKDREKGWIMEYPNLPQFELDQMSVSDYISKLKTSEVQGYPGGSMEERGLDKASDVLRLEWKNGDVTELRYISVPGDSLHSYICRDTGEVGMVTNDIINLLWVMPEQFVSLVLYKFPPSEVEEVSIIANSLKYEFVNVEGSWRVSAPEGFVLSNQNDFLRVLRNLSSLTATKAMDAGEEGDLGEVTIEVDIKKLRGENVQNKFKIGRLYIGKLDENDARYRWAKMEGRSGIFQIKQEVVDVIMDMLKSIVKQ